MTRRVLAMLALIALIPIGSQKACGQEVSSGDLSDGDRVRVSFRIPDSGSRVGTFRGIHSDSLVLGLSTDRSEVIALSDLSGLEVFAGKGRHSLAGAAVGLGAGLGVLWAQEIFDCPADAECFPPIDDFGLFRGVNGGVVVGVGVILAQWLAQRYGPTHGDPYPGRLPDVVLQPSSK